MKVRMNSKVIALIVAMMLVFSVFSPSAFAATSNSGKTEITKLTTNGLTNALGIDSTKPEFGWQMKSNIIGAKQTAYQVVVKDPSGNTVWDSGKVASDLSTATYAGSSLKARTQYTWTVKVTDATGVDTQSAATTFECGLMSTSQKAWSGAEWIGANELTLDAASASYFKFTTNITIPAGNTKASVILGANDYRLKNSIFNAWRSAKEVNYFKFEIDITNPDAAVFNVYVVGMPAKGQTTENDAATPDFTYSIPTSAISSSNAHNPIAMQIDTLANINSLTFTLNNVVVKSKVQLNPLGGDHNTNSFPNLNSIGFAVPSGGTATYSDMTVWNPGPYSTGILFNATTGATNKIFSDLKNDNVIVNADNTITVNGGASSETIAYADPSYGSAPMVRSEFETQSDIASARLYATAQGIYEVYLNGKKVSSDWFNPGNAEYREEIPYQTYDVTDMVKKGNNAIGAQLAEGWWSGYQTYTVGSYNYYGDKQAFMAKLVVTYKNGSTETFVTNNDTWKYYGKGPMEYADNYNGERYNAQKDAAVAGWTEAGYDDSAWIRASEIETRAAFANYKLTTRYDKAAGVQNELPAKTVQESRPGSGSYIYDIGENVIGVPQITIPAGYADDGAKITVRYAEVLYPKLPEYTKNDLDGLMMVENYRAALSTDFYTAKAGAQVIEPHFTFHGYRYVEISGLKKALPIENVKTLVLSSIKTTATYDSSNSLVNRLFKNVQNSQTSNFLTLMTDCPQRNERMGWLGDAQVFSTAASYNADVYNFARQFMKSVRSEQGPDGNLTVTAPSYPAYNMKTGVVDMTVPGGFAGTSWSGAIAFIPYYMYKQYGKTDIIKENLDAMVKYLNFLDNNDMQIPVDNGDGTYSFKTVGELTSKTAMLADWLSRVPTDATLINNAVYIYLTQITAEMANAIGETSIANTLNARYAAAKAKWNEVYIDPTTGKTRSVATYATPRGGSTPVFTPGAIQDTEASYATPLRFGIVSDANIERAVANYDNIVKNPAAFTDTMGAVKPYTITSGFSGTPNLVPVLTQYGFVDDAYKLFEQTDYASWLYPVTQGATSVWERWNGYTLENGFGGNNGMNSFNHFALGAISEWMMSYQLGIITQTGNSGYKKFTLQPTVGGTFTYAKGTFESNYGQIFSGWTKNDTGLDTYKTVIPANSSATLYLPVSACDNFKPVEGVTFIGMTKNNNQNVAKFELASGGYEFTVNGKSVTAKISSGYVSAGEGYTVSFNANGGSNVAAQIVTRGGLVTKPANPTKAGFAFDGWYSDPSLTNAWNFSQNTVKEATTLYAKWSANSKFQINVASNNNKYGTVSGGGSLQINTTATLTAVPQAGYRFEKWIEGYTRIYSGAVYTFKVANARNITACFAKIGTPTVKAAPGGYDRNIITWSEVTGANGYYIYRAGSKNGTYNKIATVPETTLGYVDKAVKTGSTYYYKVKAYCVAGTKVTTGSTSSVQSAKPSVPKVSGIKLIKGSSKSILVKWSAVSGGADNYQLYRATSKNGKYSLVTTTANLSYMNANLKAGKKYYFKVRAVKVVNGVKLFGAYSDLASLKL